MSVTDKQPTKAGQRVQEIFSDTRGWVTRMWTNDDKVPVADVEWDDPNELDEEGFPIEALRVVEIIAVDLDHWQDPATHPTVETSYTPEDGVTHYVVNTALGQHTLRGVDQARQWLMGYHQTDRS